MTTDSRKTFPFVCLGCSRPILLVPTPGKSGYTYEEHSAFAGASPESAATKRNCIWSGRPATAREIRRAGAPKLFPFESARVFVGGNDHGYRRPMIDLKCHGGTHWRRVRAEALRAMARIEELSGNELWCVTLSDANNSRASIHLELARMESDEGAGSELARGQAILEMARKELAP